MVPCKLGISTEQRAVLSEDGYVLFPPWTGKMSSVDSTENPAEILDTLEKMLGGVFNRISK